MEQFDQDSGMYELQPEKCNFRCALGKYVYSNILKILPPKHENLQIKIDIFHISAQKHRLWVLVRTASARQF